MKIRKFIAFCLLILLSACNSTPPSNDGWEVTYKYNYEDNDGVYTTQKVSDRAKLTKPSDPTREDYTFTTWYRDSYCKIEWDFSNDRVTAPTTLYAGWEVESKTYSITWDNVPGATFRLVDSGTLPTEVSKNSPISFTVTVDSRYEGTPVVTVDNNEITAENGIYTVTVSKNIVISVSGLVEKDGYTFYFTLPSNWSPAASNPRLYYWSNSNSSINTSNTLFSNGVSSNMTVYQGTTYMIDIDDASIISGMIIIFDQGNEVKQSHDMVVIPSTPGEYEIKVADWATWTQNTSGAWCFTANIVAK